MVKAMNTDELTRSAEKMLSGFDDAVKELTPHIVEMLDKIKNKSEEFESQREVITKEIDRGARTTKHRLHL
jgi:hypothetical protein